MRTNKPVESDLFEDIWVEETYPEGRVASRVKMHRDRRTGELSHTASGLRTLDRLRAVLQDVSSNSSPGHVKSLREALGLTQQEFAVRLDVNVQSVSRWERGEAKPGSAVLRRLHVLQRNARKRGVAVPVNPVSAERRRRSRRLDPA